jgi:hypothetical protein
MCCEATVGGVCAASAGVFMLLGMAEDMARAIHSNGWMSNLERSGERGPARGVS